MNNRYGGVIWTDHAIQRLYERNLSQEDAWYSFQHPDGQLKSPKPGVYCYYKDYDNQRIEVVATQNENKEWIILSCWSRLTGKSKPQNKTESFFWSLLKKIFRKLTTGLRGSH